MKKKKIILHEGKKLHRKRKDVEIKKKGYQEIKKKKITKKTTNNFEWK